MGSEDLPAALPNDLPGAEFLLDRQGATDINRNNLRPIFATISALTLKTLTRQTDIPFPSCVFTGERVWYSAKVPYVLTRFWPVTQLMQAFVGASTHPITIGSEQQLAQGRAQLAIAQPDGDRLRFRGHSCPDELFVTYRGGMDKLPADLLEVFSELAFLMWKENTRIGMTSDKMKDAQINFTRQLPTWAQRTLNSYRRIGSFV